MIPREKAHTVFHLGEAIQQLKMIRDALESDLDYNGARFSVDIEHAYHHLNYAWNSRRLGGKRAWEAREADFYKYCQMPTDIDFGLRK